MFTHSICSYPQRSHHGSNRYRGNCPGQIVQSFVQTYNKRKDCLLADPSIGSGTSGDVAKEMGIRFFGTDLHQGFNLLTDDFAEHMGEQANLVWWHPPYWNMIKYSGNQWGDQPHKWDMSHMEIDEFVESLELAVMNIHDACLQGGHYGILMGNMRKQGRYYNLSSLVERVAPGVLVDEIIKTQHNCVSDSRQYSGNIVRIAHEKLLVFRKGAQASLFFLEMTHRRASNMLNTTWRAAVRKILMGKTMPLAEIYAKIEPYAKHRNNNNWQAKVRQILQDGRYFDRVETGVYRLAS